jgi:hypothetical protein
VKCSFCEQPLVCKACNRPFRARAAEALTAVYQPEMIVVCPECQKTLVCKACGFAYGEEEEEDTQA